MEVGEGASFYPSEYSQLVNCKNSLVRSFNVTVVNDKKNVGSFALLTAKIRFPALLTMGCIMDMEGYSSQVSVSFTPLQEMVERVGEECDAIGAHSVKLKRFVYTCFRQHTQ